MNIPDNVKVSECTNALVWRGADGFIYINNKKGVSIDIDNHKETFTIIRELCRGKRCGLIVDFVGIKSMTKESRDYSGSNEHLSYVRAVAILISNSFTRILANFFMGLNKPVFPTQLFTKEEEAISWLSRQEK